MYKLLILLVIFFLNINSFAKEGVITVASTTSTHDTGLLKSINKEFTNKFNIKVNVISLGTGQAIRIAKEGGNLILHDINNSNLEKTSAEVSSNCNKLYTICLNEYIPYILRRQKSIFKLQDFI